MKKLVNLLLLYSILINVCCAQEGIKENCEMGCSEGPTVETIVDMEAKVIKFYDHGFILTTNADDFEHDFFVHATDEFILVPCNWTYSYAHNTRVIVSGRKINCCRLLTFPNERRGFGCKFEITSIALLKP